ncbi:MAG: branched-chain amino acid ABC transporter permease [Acidimicrobiales bacterium]|nr:branched-chain amino acid ABC transporter permease [Acidimicrobiales bacterium]
MSLPKRIAQGGRNHRLYLLGSWGLLALLAFLVPFLFAETFAPELFGNKYTVSLANVNKSLAWAVAILGLTVLTGFSGQISLGHTFFVGTGAYTSAILVEFFDWPYLATLVVVIPMCLVIGLIIGIPAVRITGLYLALITFGLAAVFPSIPKIEQLADRDGWNTGGSNGLRVSKDLETPSWLPTNGIAEFLQGIPLIGGMFGSDGLPRRGADDVYVYFLLLLVAAIAFLLVRNLMKSRPGRAIIAIRDNPTGAQVSGINPAAVKTIAFGISGILGGVAGVMFTMMAQFVGPDEFTTNLAIFFVVGMIVGGVGTLGGSIIGGLAIVFVPAWAGQTETLPIADIEFGAEFGPLILGVLLILLMFAMPGGITSGFRQVRARLVQIIPRAPST